VLRPGNAGSNTAADLITAGRLVLAQIASHLRKRCGSPPIPVAAPTSSLPGERPPAEVFDRFDLTEEICATILALPADFWQPAYDADGQVRDGAWVAELTGWPKGMRLLSATRLPRG
jgi:hypothetical protein